MPPSVDPLDAARSLLAAGDAMSAFRTLRPLLRFEAAQTDRTILAARLALFAEVSRALAGNELAACVASVAASPDDPQSLFYAAYALYEQKLHDIAAGLLLRANDLAPHQPGIVAVLSCNLEAAMRYDLAASALGRSGLSGRDPLCTYLHGFNALMSGDVETARDRAGAIDERDDNLASMAASLRGMVARTTAIGAALPLHRDELTGWHAAINGTVLLHESPFGFEEGMRGRYAYVNDSPGLMHEGIERLGALLAATRTWPPRVIAAPDRASRILALAASKMLRLPAVLWSADDHGAGLVCCWDLDAVGDEAFFLAAAHHAPGRPLFAHASRWIEPSCYAPDVTTLMYQQCGAAYTGGSMRMNPDTQQVELSGADPRPDVEIAEEIAATTPREPSRRPLDAALAVLHATKDLPEAAQLGLRRTRGLRPKQWAGGPVMSNYFS